MSARRPKASDIDDREIIHIVEALCVLEQCWVCSDLVSRCYPEFPFKVVAAKLARLLRRGLVTGCPCGCRGDWELTTAGRAFAGIERGWRPNPMESAA